MFSLRFVGTACHNRNCMKMGKHDRTQFRTIGCTNFCNVPYLSPLIYYSGSNFLSSPKTPVIATEKNCILFALIATSKSLPKLPCLGLQTRAVSTSVFSNNISSPFHISFIPTNRTQFWRHVLSDLLDQSVQIVTSFQNRLSLVFLSWHLWIINGYWITVACTYSALRLHSPRTAAAAAAAAAACLVKEVRSKWICTSETNS